MCFVIVSLAAQTGMSFSCLELTSGSYASSQNHISVLQFYGKVLKYYISAFLKKNMLFYFQVEVYKMVLMVFGGNL